VSQNALAWVRFVFSRTGRLLVVFFGSGVASLYLGATAALIEMVGCFCLGRIAEHQGKSRSWHVATRPVTSFRLRISPIVPVTSLARFPPVATARMKMMQMSKRELRGLGFVLYFRAVSQNALAWVRFVISRTARLLVVFLGSGVASLYLGATATLI
jgi:hypothetical protein